jgi:serine/threonine kinase 32
MAPEVIAKKTGYTASCDWWSLGVVLYELVCGKKPFKGSNRDEVKRNVLNQPISFRENIKKRLSENCIDFISSLLDRDPILRTRRIKTHPWFDDVDWDAVGRKKARPIFVPHPGRCHFALELEAEATELYHTPRAPKSTKSTDCFADLFKEFSLSSCRAID